MFKQTAVTRCLVLFLTMAATACSSTDQRTRNSNRSALPASPIMPQARNQAPRNIYVPPAFEEYQPRQPYSNNRQGNYGEYAPEKNYRDSYTTAIERQPRAVVEVLRPQDEIQSLAPVTVEPLNTIVERDNRNRNELDIDPFASVPDREVVSATNRGVAKAPPANRPAPSMSRAASALLRAARAESSKGRTDAAINKVERALRIEPRSAALWHQLAELNFQKGRYDQAIGFARKALPMAAGNRNQQNQSLNLMSKAAVKAGNTRVFKEVLDYKKQNF